MLDDPSLLKELDIEYLTDNNTLEFLEAQQREGFVDVALYVKRSEDGQSRHETIAFFRADGSCRARHTSTVRREGVERYTARNKVYEPGELESYVLYGDSQALDKIPISEVIEEKRTKN